MKIVKILGTAVVGLIGLVLVIGLIAQKSFKVERSIVINAPYELVVDQIIHFKNFQEWEPWGHLDPNMEASIEGEDGQVGAIYRWNGNDDVGSGSQEVMSITAERIEIRLSFTEPWESENLAFYNLRETNGGVEVTWGMEGDVPFPMNTMLIFDDMDESVGSDFAKGLESLKNRCEAMAGQQVNGYWINKIDVPERTYIGKRETMTFDQMQAFFIENLPKIQEAINIKGFKVDGAPSGLFFEYDESAGTTDMAAAIPTSGRKLYVDGYESIFGGRKALFLAYYGDYSNMAVPHLAMDAYMEQNNSGEHLLVIEEYITDPTLEPDTSKWLTNIYYVME